MSARRSARRSARSKSPDAPSGEGMPGLRKLVQKRILKDVFEHASGQHPGWKVLILDDLAMRVISSAVGMYDIMERKVTLVESLNKKRAPFTDMGAIYLIEPKEDSINKILEDFVAGKVLYGKNVFIFTLGRLPDSQLDKIKACRPLLKRLKALSEINIDFLAKEDRAFTLDMKDCFGTFYLRKGVSSVERKLVDRLVTVCATLNEYPHIRFRQSSAICSSLASVFHLKMDEFVDQNPSWWYHGGPEKGQQTSRERGTLLLLDRADDCLTPLMHDFTYQSMVHDLLPMDEDRITIEAETGDEQTEAKDILLDEKDALWVELRGKHIAEVINTLSSRIREIMNSSTGSTLGKSGGSKGNMSLSQMASALKALPEYKEVMSKLSQHMHIAHECMDVFKKETLMELSELEQTLATGKDDEGRSPKLADLIDEAEGRIMKMKDPKERLRLILITTISQGGLRQQDRRRLMNAAELSRKDMRTLNSLEILGLSIFSSTGTEKKGLLSSLTGGRVSSGGQSDDEAEYAGSRFVPMIKSTLEDLCNGCLSIEEYPSVLPMPESAGGGSSKKGSVRSSRREGTSSARKAAGASSRWSKSSASSSGKASAGPSNFSGGRGIVFMVGGLAYSEIRSAREVMQSTSREIILGSTAFVSPKQYLSDLELLGQEED